MDIYVKVMRPDVSDEKVGKLSHLATRKGTLD